MVDVNLDELAGLLRLSVPTAKKLVEKYPDLPVIERGGAGKAWKFDAESVIEFFRVIKEAEDAERARKGDMMAELVLPLGAPRDKNGKEISFKDQSEAAKLRKLLRDEQIETGFLVSTAEMRATLERLMRSLVANENAALVQIEREHKIPAPVMAAIRAKFDNARTVFVRDAAALLSAPDDHGEDGLFAAAE